MNQRNSVMRFRKQPIRVAWLMSFVLLSSTLASAEAPPAARAAFQHYVEQVECGLAAQHASPVTFFALPETAAGRSGPLRPGQSLVERLTPVAGLAVPGGLIHHWRETAFVPGAHAADFVRLLSDVQAYPRLYAPQVLAAGQLEQNASTTDAWMRVRQQHGLVVVMDLHYRLTLKALDAAHGYSLSRTTRVDELTNDDGRFVPLPANKEHGFLWQLNSYWSYEERDGGLYLQLETVSLSRAIPLGLGWIVGPFIESVPEQSLMFTVNATAKALKQGAERAMNGAGGW